MVNVPPLLCSTPPPIDFGEEDEDVDVMPPTLDGVDDEEFGDFLTMDDSKNDEPIPSPRPPSLSDLPEVNIYDGLIPPPQEDLTHHIAPPPPIDEEISKENPNNNNNTTSKNITEAYNYNIKIAATEEAYNKTKDRIQDTSQEEEQHEIEENPFKNINNSETELCYTTSKNPKELRIDTSADIENKCNADKTNLNSIQNMVSIEDIEDDLSDDELYSPRTPKNFTQPDDIKDFFKIQEINQADIQKNESKSTDSTKETDTKSIDSLDNQESASVENENEYKSFSSNSFPHAAFDLPPPLDDQQNSIDDDDDDFGDFADFQDFNTAITSTDMQANVDNSVPVNDINNKQLNNNDDLEVNDFKEFNSHNLQKESTIEDNELKYEINENVSLDSLKQPDEVKDSLEDYDDEFEDFTSHTLTANKFKIQNDNIQQEEVNMDNVESKQMSAYDNNINTSVSQDNLNDSFGDFNNAPVINGEIKNKDNSFSDWQQPNITNEEKAKEDFNEPPELTENPPNIEDSFGDFNEATVSDDSVTPQSPSKQIASSENAPINDNGDYDEFNDFADFEQHQEITKIEQKVSENISTIPSDHNDFDDDDDDFGDFNTAEPLTPPTASTIAPLKTSQNISATTTATAPKNLNERISKILQLMFITPMSNNAENTTDPKSQKIQDIPFTSIDAAKALEYQWLNSDTRHSFIKSLGIDSKNILFGENWNPSLPRFAANLSFNPLKPMKPVLSSNNMVEPCSNLEPISINTTESYKSLSMDSSNSIKKENIGLDWKSTNIPEQINDAFKDNTLTSREATLQPAATTSMQYVSNEPPSEPTSLTIFDKPLANEETFSKTPPISEMESVTTFSSPLPISTLEMDLPPTQIINNLNDFDLKEIEENLKNTLNINEVVVTSTFTGAFKETHIYTPSKTSDFETKQTSSSPSKATPIDFDYEKAAMGVVIDETVVKKEYRDVEYNPPFSMESINKSSTNKVEMFETNIFVTTTNNNMNNGNDIKMSVDTTPVEEEDSNDDFTEFQSMPSENTITVASVTVAPITQTKPKQKEVLKPSPPQAAAVSHGGMILSPAILIPQAIFMENNKPKIEWGDSTTNINAEEMARIEELFPEPKSQKSSNASNSSQRSTPTHQQASTPSISATIANKEFGGGGGANNDDDDWSDFVSVPITNNISSNRTVANNNLLTKTPAGSPFKQRSPVVPHKIPTTTNSNNDDEWSDFVSSAPQPVAQPPSYRVPQFNSGAWQNANFYNNPLSMYHKGPINISSTAGAVNQPSPKHFYNNNNNNYNLQHQQQYQTANNIPPIGHHHQQQPTPQQIHIMQNFSTAPVPTPERLTAAGSAAATVRNNQFQVGSAKVAPSIALIPDLGFVAPAIPTHTSFINSLPKPSINTKK